MPKKDGHYPEELRSFTFFDSLYTILVEVICSNSSETAQFI